ncbi:hypothetical protein K440DRAFT_636941 [Wilcoxina mikolae CBS 423.85]|nr:hypothetical protein K440DRAFT_636941 [Wilcoxina mikolae CBS 423.85]
MSDSKSTQIFPVPKQAKHSVVSHDERYRRLKLKCQLGSIVDLVLDEIVYRISPTIPMTWTGLLNALRHERQKRDLQKYPKDPADQPKYWKKHRSSMPVHFLLNEVLENLDMDMQTWKIIIWYRTCYLVKKKYILPYYTATGDLERVAQEFSQCFEVPEEDRRALLVAAETLGALRYEYGEGEESSDGDKSKEWSDKSVGAWRWPVLRSSVVASRVKMAQMGGASDSNPRTVLVQTTILGGQQSVIDKVNGSLFPSFLRASLRARREKSGHESRLTVLYGQTVKPCQHHMRFASD